MSVHALQTLAHPLEAFRTPEQLVLDHIAWDPEYSHRFGLRPLCIVSVTSFTREIVSESGRFIPRLCEKSLEHSRIFDVELSPPKPFVHRIVVGAKVALVLCKVESDVARGSRAPVCLLPAGSPYSCNERAATDARFGRP